MRRNVQARDGGGGCVTIHRCLGDSGRRFGTTAAFTDGWQGRTAHGPPTWPRRGANARTDGSERSEWAVVD